MKQKVLLFVTFVALTLAISSINIRAQSAATSVFASELRAPIKIILTPKGNLMVAEAGNGPNTGRISILDLNGNRRTLVDGLPSGFSPPNNDPSGPAGLAFRGRTLFVVIGTGDGTLVGPVPGTDIPNPNPSSPFLSSVLSIRLSPDAEATTQGFTITLADQMDLQSRGFIRLTDALGNGLTVEVVTNFRNFTSDFPSVAVRPSNLFGIVVRDNRLYVVDASQNTVFEVDSDTGQTRSFFRFPGRQNPTPIGPRFIDTVPNSIRLIGKSLLVPFLTGFPFPQGTAEVRKIRLANGANEPFITGLSSAIDVLPAKNATGDDQFFTLEFSSNMLAMAPGRLSRFDQNGGAQVVLVSNLVSPTSLAQDPVTGDLFVTEIFAGRVTRVRLP